MLRVEVGVARFAVVMSFRSRSFTRRGNLVDPRAVFMSACGDRQIGNLFMLRVEVCIARFAVVVPFRSRSFTRRGDLVDPRSVFMSACGDRQIGNLFVFRVEVRSARFAVVMSLRARSFTRRGNLVDPRSVLVSVCGNARIDRLMAIFTFFVSVSLFRTRRRNNSNRFPVLVSVLRIYLRTFDDKRPTVRRRQLITNRLDARCGCSNLLRCRCGNPFRVDIELRFGVGRLVPCKIPEIPRRREAVKRSKFSRRLKGKSHTHVIDVRYRTERGIGNKQLDRRRILSARFIVILRKVDVSSVQPVSYRRSANGYPVAVCADIEFKVRVIVPRVVIRRTGIRRVRRLNPRVNTASLNVLRTQVVANASVRRPNAQHMLLRLFVKVGIVSVKFDIVYRTDGGIIPNPCGIDKIQFGKLMRVSARRIPPVAPARHIVEFDLVVGRFPRKTDVQLSRQGIERQVFHCDKAFRYRMIPLVRHHRLDRSVDVGMHRICVRRNPNLEIQNVVRVRAANTYFKVGIVKPFVRTVDVQFVECLRRKIQPVLCKIRIIGNAFVRRIAKPYQRASRLQNFFVPVG